MAQSGYTLEGGGHAVILLHGRGESPERLRPLAESLCQSGLTVCVPALFQPGRHWTGWLLEARGAFVHMQNTHVLVSLCGLGDGVYPALLLAEEYMADQLLLVPGPPAHGPWKDRISFCRLARRAKRNLFAVTAQSHVLLTEPADRRCARQARSLVRLLGRCGLTGYAPGQLAGSVSRCLQPL